MTAPLVSILIPAYGERFFAEAFASALAQDYPSLEIVILDDSPGALVQETVARAKDPRVRYERNAERRGFAGNFTECFRQARGELVKFLNDDDRLRPQCVSKLAAALVRYPEAHLATSRRAVIDELGRIAADQPATTAISVANCLIEGRELADLVLVNSINLIGEPSTVLFRREAIVPRRGESLFHWSGHEYHCLADLALWIRLLAQGPAYYHAAILSEYRVHPGQEQRTQAMGIDCIAERLHLARAARAAGFIAEARQYAMALERIQALATHWGGRAGLPLEQRQSIEALRGEIERERTSEAMA